MIPSHFNYCNDWTRICEFCSETSLQTRHLHLFLSSAYTGCLLTLETEALCLGLVIHVVPMRWWIDDGKIKRMKLTQETDNGLEGS